MMRVVVPSERLLAATTPTIPMITIAPTTIQSHGMLLVEVDVVVVPSVLVDLSVVVAEPAFGAVAAPPVVAGPVVVVVLEPDVPVVCAKVIAGAMTRKSARSIKLRRKIGRMCFLPRMWATDVPFPRKTESENSPTDD
jgi:hypothetical protein